MALTPGQTTSGHRFTVNRWFDQHRRAFNDTCRYIGANIAAVSLAAFVIGFSLTIPLGVFVAYGWFAALVDELGTHRQATLFLDDAVSVPVARDLVARLSNDPRFSAVEFVDRAQSLREFKSSSDLAAALDALGSNPLPHLITVKLPQQALNAAALTEMRTELTALMAVEAVEIDLLWIEKLATIMRIARRVSIILALILALGVVLITGHTIRASVQHRREEIELAKLCGATDAYVRRAFLYYGAIQGLAGAVVSCCVVGLALMALGGPVGAFASLYGTELPAVSLPVKVIAVVCLAALGLGCLGAWIAATYYIRRMDVAAPND